MSEMQRLFIVLVIIGLWIAIPLWFITYFIASILDKMRGLK